MNHNRQPALHLRILRPGSRRMAAAVLAGVLTVILPVVAPSQVDASRNPAAAAEHVRRTLGFYPGFGDADVLRSLEQELGFELGVVVQFGGSQSPDDLTGSIHGQLAGLSGWIAERDPLYSLTIPLAFGDADARSAEGIEEIAANLADVAAGAHDRTYDQVADMLVAAGLGDAVLRIGHEFDGDWYAWSAQASCDGYIAAFRHVADVFHAVSSEFRIEWTGTVRNFADWGECAYPGDEHVDIVGLDVYDQGGPMSAFSHDAASWHDPASVWTEQFVPRLELHHEFAVDHGKPVSYPEWALVTASNGAYGGDNPTFIRAMAAWLRSLPAEGPGALSYHAYFLGGSEFDFHQFGRSTTAFLDEFGTAAAQPQTMAVAASSS